MNEPSVQGKIHLIEDTKTYGQKGFRKRLVVLEQDNSRFVNYIPFDFIQEGCDAVDNLNVGDQVEISYRLSGRRWQRDPESEVKFFLSAEAVNFRVLTGSEGSGGARPASRSANDAFQEAADEDVPF